MTQVRFAQGPAGPTRGRCHPRDPHEGGDADRDRADHGEDDLPGVGGHSVFHDAVRRVVAGKRRGRDEGKCDRKAHPERTDNGEQELPEPEPERQCGGDEADDACAEPAGAGLIGPCPGANAREERQREDSQGEQQPAQAADRGDAGEDTDKIMVVFSAR